MKQKKLLVALVALIVAATGSVGLYAAAHKNDNATAVPQYIQDSQAHRRLDFLVGDWSVEKKTYIAGGSVVRPMLSSGITSHWVWVARTNGQFLHEEIQGTLGGKPYYRFGTLGFSLPDKRYELSTIDGFNSMMMNYKSVPDPSGGDISMGGEFTDGGVLGVGYLGKTITMRFVIHKADNNHFTTDLYFTPPNEPERLVDSAVYSKK